MEVEQARELAKAWFGRHAPQVQSISHEDEREQIAQSLAALLPDGGEVAVVDTPKGSPRLVALAEGILYIAIVKVGKQVATRTQVHRIVLDPERTRIVVSEQRSIEQGGAPRLIRTWQFDFGSDQGLTIRAEALGSSFQATAAKESNDLARHLAAAVGWTTDG